MISLKENINYIKDTFNIEDSIIDQTNTLTIRSKVRKSDIKYKDLNDLLYKIKDKDFSINIKTVNPIEGSYINFSKSREKNLIRECIADFIEDLNNISESNFDIEIRFDKTKYSKNNVYVYAYLETFLESLKNNWIENNIFNIDSINNNKTIILIVEEENLYNENDFLIICSCDKFNFKSMRMETVENEKYIINISKETCNWINLSHLYSPNSLNFTSCDNENIDILFRKINTIVIMMYISNYVEMKNNEIVCVINSVKRIVVKIPLALSELNVEDEQYKWLFKCFSLIYSNYNRDKFSILRNVIGSLIVCKNQGESYKVILENSKWIYNSTNDNWEMFLSSNIDKYFEKKYTIIENIENKIIQVHDQTSNIVKDIYKNAISIMILIIGSIVGKNMKVVKWSGIVGIIYLFIYGIAFFPLIFIQKKDIKDKFETLIKNYVKEFNPSIEEINNNENKFNQKQKTLNIYIGGYIVLYILTITILFIIVINNSYISNGIKS